MRTRSAPRRWHTLRSEGAQDEEDDLGALAGLFEVADNSLQQTLCCKMHDQKSIAELEQNRCVVQSLTKSYTKAVKYNRNCSRSVEERNNYKQHKSHE